MSDARAADDEDAATTDTAGYDVPNPEAKEFDWRGWLLVGTLVLTFLVVPWTIIALPAAQESIGSIGLGWRQAYLVLPLVPALLLGALGAWTAVANRRP